jgi:YesN/AraC family two-component response regulator
MRNKKEALMENLSKITETVEYSPEPEEALSLKVIEECYKNENAILEAISKGDVKRALQCKAVFHGYQSPQRTPEKLRNFKNYLIVLNSLSRKAVEYGFVHPAHIDAVSADFARRIEAATSISELSSFSEMMIRRYCALVEQFSLRQHSAVVRNVINTVDFSLQEPLSLASLSKQFNINPNYLSGLFKRETGQTLTDYINTKRMRHAASLLRNSSIYIQEVAEQCGFTDINYFTRLFKRQYGMPPREFRAG